MVFGNTLESGECGFHKPKQQVTRALAIAGRDVHSSDFGSLLGCSSGLKII
jgi:hypothetical protein